MAILSKEELIEKVKTIVGEDISDEALSFVEDFTDTITSYEGTDDWKTKFDENDSMWRQKYKDRFFSTEVVEELDETKDETIDEEEDVDIDDLFEDVNKEEK